jgi:hypothetical protein
VAGYSKPDAEAYDGVPVENPPTSRNWSLAGRLYSVCLRTIWN